MAGGFADVSGAAVPFFGEAATAAEALDRLPADAADFDSVFFGGAAFFEVERDVVFFVPAAGLAVVPFAVLAVFADEFDAARLARGDFAEADFLAAPFAPPLEAAALLREEVFFREVVFFAGWSPAIFRVVLLATAACLALRVVWFESVRKRRRSNGLRESCRRHERE